MAVSPRAVPNESELQMRRFWLRAPADNPGVYHPAGSVVAEGVEFTDGRVAMRWLGIPSSSTWFDDLAELHDVYTACTINWLDQKE